MLHIRTPSLHELLSSQPTTPVQVPLNVGSDTDVALPLALGLDSKMATTPPQCSERKSIVSTPTQQTNPAFPVRTPRKSTYRFREKKVQTQQTVLCIDLLFHILGYLPMAELLRAKNSCKLWLDLVSIMLPAQAVAFLVMQCDDTQSVELIYPSLIRGLSYHPTDPKKVFLAASTGDDDLSLITTTFDSDDCSGNSSRKIERLLTGNCVSVNFESGVLFATTRSSSELFVYDCARSQAVVAPAGTTRYGVSRGGKLVAFISHSTLTVRKYGPGACNSSTATVRHALLEEAEQLWVGDDCVVVQISNRQTIELIGFRIDRRGLSLAREISIAPRAQNLKGVVDGKFWIGFSAATMELFRWEVNQPDSKVEKVRLSLAASGPLNYLCNPSNPNAVAQRRSGGTPDSNSARTMEASASSSSLSESGTLVGPNGTRLISSGTSGFDAICISMDILVPGALLLCTVKVPGILSGVYLQGEARFEVLLLSMDGTAVRRLRLPGLSFVAPHPTRPMLMTTLAPTTIARQHPLVDAVENGMGRIWEFKKPCGHDPSEVPGSSPFSRQLKRLVPTASAQSSTQLLTTASRVAYGVVTVSLLWTISALIYNGWWTFLQGGR
jgi:hypothetical protein